MKMKTKLRLHYSSKNPEDNVFSGEMKEQGDMWNFTGNIRHRKVDDSRVVTDFQVKVIYWEWVVDLSIMGATILGHYRTATKLEWYNTNYFELEFEEEITYQTCN